MTDPIQIERLCNNLRGELSTLSQRAEHFGMLPASIREPILERIHTMLTELDEGVSLIRDLVETEIARQRGDDPDREARERFRKVTGG